MAWVTFRKCCSFPNRPLVEHQPPLSDCFLPYSNLQSNLYTIPKHLNNLQAITPSTAIGQVKPPAVADLEHRPNNYTIHTADRLVSKPLLQAVLLGVTLDKRPPNEDKESRQQIKFDRYHINHSCLITICDSHDMDKVSIHIQHGCYRYLRIAGEVCPSYFIGYIP